MKIIFFPLDSKAVKISSFY